MKYGIAVRNMGPQATASTIRACVKAAETLGFDAVFVSDHLCIPPDQTEGSGGRYLDVLATLAYLAGATERIRLGISVLVLPYRPAVLTAKQVATIQELSGHRLILGAGVGWMRPEFDALGRPAWLFGETVHRNCVRAGYYEEGVFARRFGDKECLVEVGCWGPVVNCNITSRGAINHLGGCMNTGGVCIGCTMPGFPDRFAPFYKKPPGSTLSTASSRLLGTFIRPLRRFTQTFQNREPRWDEQGHAPSGWGHVPEAGPVKRFFHYLYQKYQFLGSSDPSARRKRPEHVERKSEQDQRGGV